GDDQFERVMAVLWQRDPQTCHSIEVPRLTITPEARAASGQVNTGDLVTFQVFHDTKNGLRGETRFGYFVPEAGAEYSIIDHYNGLNPGKFSVSLVEKKTTDGIARERTIDMYALGPARDRILDDCFSRSPT
ncbi:MAG TPA: hypothetical protein VE175_04765, partial [Woeseiaceae bacterium]|nr:hypothetical protein [Woeseiaceae bacterium]